jgi:hypothetical protein
LSSSSSATFDRVACWLRATKGSISSSAVYGGSGRGTKEAGRLATTAQRARLSPHGTAVSLLANKMKHGNLCVLPWPVLRSKGPLVEHEPLPHAKPQGQGKCSPCVFSKNIDLIYLCYPEEQKAVKTAWEYYNEGTYPATSPHIL